MRIAKGVAIRIEKGIEWVAKGIQQTEQTIEQSIEQTTEQSIE